MNCNQQTVHAATRVDIVTDPESGVKFIRKTCISCGRWIGDKVINE